MTSTENDNGPGRVSVHVGSIKGGNGIYLPVDISGYMVSALVDTGANITLLKTDIFQTRPVEERPVLEPATCELILANGETVPLLGTATLDITVASKTLKYRVWIADIEPDSIIGFDVLEELCCVLDIPNKQIIIDGEVINYTQKEECEAGLRRIKAVSTMVIPGNSEMLIAGKLSAVPADERYGLIEPHEQFRHRKNVLVAHAVVSVEKPVVPVRVVNLSPDPVTVYKNTNIANLESITAIGNNDTKHECMTSTDGINLPVHLEELYIKSCTELNDDQSEQVARLLNQFSNSFSKGPEDIGKTNVVQHKINTGEHAPIKQSPRRVPLQRKETVRTHIDQMMKNGKIEESSSPWASPIVLVAKKDGTTRFCIDYRKLNDVTIKDSYPLPKIDESLDMLGGSTWFSTLDLASGYWQIEMAEEDKGKTAFVTNCGLYQFNVMPFGLCNAPATFERLMECILRGLQWHTCLIYLDDVIVHASSFKVHIQRLEVILQRLQAAGLKLSPKKCNLFKTEVAYLGHRITSEGIRTDPNKIKAVRDWPQPQNLTEVRSFLGLCAYYRRFIQGFATIAKPLHRLTEKGKRFSWDDESEQAFQRLKRALIEAPVLTYPERDGLFIIDSDASQFGIGAVLSQEQGGNERVISYFSRTLSKAERQYCVTRKELLAVVCAVKQFHHYVYGRRFLVRTDHGALRWLINFKNPEGQLARWIEILDTYDVQIQHRPGRVHQNADALSRRPCGPCSHCERKEANDRHQKSEHTCDENMNSNITEDEFPKCMVITGQSAEKCPNQPWFNSWSNTELIALQGEDPDIQLIAKWKNDATEKPPWEDVSSKSNAARNYWLKWEELVLREGVLYRKFEADGGDIWWQLVVPKGIRAEVLCLAHDHRLSGHMRVRKTLQRLRPKFYWSGYRRDIERYCQQCEQCSTRKGTSKYRANMGTYLVGSPMQRCAMDIMGPLPMTHNGNKYILVISDYFTKWTEAFAIPNQEARTVATILVQEFVCRYGVPRELHTDQGRQFESALFQEMCRLLDIEKTRTTSFHPQSDGMVERFNRTLKDMLAAVVAPDQKDWDTWLPYLMMAYRSAVHTSTGFTPTELMLGRNVTLPLDLLLPKPPDDNPICTTDFADQLEGKMKEVYEVARSRLQMSNAKQKTLYDRKAHIHQYNEGDCVWLRDEARKKGISPKLQNQWIGPCLVLKRISDVNYKIKLGPRKKPKIVHHNRLKPHQGEVKPKWTIIHEKYNTVGTQTLQEQYSTSETTLDDNSLHLSEATVQKRTRKKPTHYGQNIYD